MPALRRFSVAACLLALTLTAQQRDVLKLVDPMIGTGPEGHTFPGAVAPFGMVQLSPDTQIKNFKESYKWAAGYRYEDTTILGFSHTHFSGAGHSDLGDVLVMPDSDDTFDIEPGDIEKKISGYRKKFSHSTEVSEPGYYAVTLEPNERQPHAIRAELTATDRVGVHRYSFHADDWQGIVLDLRSSIYNYPGKVLWSSLRIRKDDTVTGTRTTRGWAPNRHLFFAIRFSRPIVADYVANREEPAPVYKGFQTPGIGENGETFVQGRAVIGRFFFGKSTEPLIIKVALSNVSEENAIANMDAEVPGFDFDAARAQTQNQWREELGRLEFHASPAMEKNLYTALYHAMMAPSVADDVNGEYRGPDNEVHRTVTTDGQKFNFVSTLSLWDTYRAEQPLMTLIEPAKRTNDLINSMIASQQESPFGLLPIWQFHGLETWCMIGYHAVPIIADAYMKGIRGYDANAALNAMVASASYGPYGNLNEYMPLGYVPVDNDDEAASKTMEYAFDDWTIAQMAHTMHREDIAAQFDKRGSNWQNNFNKADGFVEPRLANGDFRKPFDPAKAGHGSGFTEGNAWQYSWYQPQDEAQLINFLGGKDKLIAKLDAMFDQKVDPAQYAHVEDISGMIGQYIHGNEPSHHLAYLYMYAGAPLKTQARLKQIVDTQYKPTPDGLVGNDDLGQMSAWLIFTSLGFYPVAPASNEYVIGRPFVDSATLHLPNGKTLTIVKEGTSDFIKSLTRNGQPVKRAFFTHDELMSGGEIRFTMSGEQHAAWSHSSLQMPYSMTEYFPLIKIRGRQDLSPEP
ncbi:MAG: GH92 family glycosyl hydrolase [Acidobacteria bacterium]|nr:GH92 family glycosyl hydrolase [Acidobacteriota bacterium]